MCSAYKLNKQDDNIQPWHTPFPIFLMAIEFIIISHGNLNISISGSKHLLVHFSRVYYGTGWFKVNFQEIALSRFRFWGFPSGSEVKASAHNTGDLGSVPGLGRFPGEGQGNPLQYSWLENPIGQRSLVGYGPQGRKELDTIEWLHFHFLSLFRSRFQVYVR